MTKNVIFGKIVKVALFKQCIVKSGSFFRFSQSDYCLIMTIIKNAHNCFCDSKEKKDDRLSD